MEGSPSADNHLKTIAYVAVIITKNKKTGKEYLTGASPENGSIRNANH
jgi:hypothetical protein